jgi:hypothetical protein
MKINTTAGMEDLQKAFIFSAARKILNLRSPGKIRALNTSHPILVRYKERFEPY